MTRTRMGRQLFMGAIVFLSLVALTSAAEPKLPARSGKGALYELEGHRIAVLVGTPEEMGRQHGALLKEDVRALMHVVLNFARSADNLKKNDYFAGTIEKAYARCEKFIPGRYLREIDALADAAGVPRKDARLANVFPELFHCSGFALMGRATVGGELFHGRVLDYMTQVGLQQHAVTFICLPEGRNAFVSVGYSGFIGSVSGMNEKKVAFGEMGGRGEGKWDGMPMAFLMRKGMEEADTLDDALRIFRDTPRTCEYYYVLSDGKSRRAAGLKCTPDIFEQVNPGRPHPQLPTPIEDTVLMSAGGRYKKLVQRVQKGYGRIDADAAIALMTRPVAMKSNLHNVLFAPERLALWVAHAADPVGNPNYQACNQPYVYINVRKFLKLGRAQAADAAPEKTAVETKLPPAPKTLSGIGNDTARAPLAAAARPGIAALLERYRTPCEKFQWDARLKANALNYAIYELRFPSPIKTEFPKNNTVHCEYFRCHGSQPRPAVIVLHILDGRFLVARLVCSTLANGGIDAMMVKLPFYGERRPENFKSRLTNPEHFELLIRQGVADTRRAAALLAGLDGAAKGEVALCGVSLGGFIAALTAGVDGHFQRAVFVLSGGGLHEVLTTGSRETQKIQKRFAEHGLVSEELKRWLAPIDPLTFAHRMKGCDVAMFNVTGDEVVPASCAEALVRAAGGKSITWYKGDKHTAMLTYVFDVLKRTRAHFAK